MEPNIIVAHRRLRHELMLDAYAILVDVLEIMLKWLDFGGTLSFLQTFLRCDRLAIDGD